MGSTEEVGGFWTSLTSCFTHDMILMSQVHNSREHAGMESKCQTCMKLVACKQALCMESYGFEFCTLDLLS